MDQDKNTSGVSRRQFVAGAAAAGVAAPMIVSRHVLGGPGQTAPSEQIGGALIGCGGRGPGTFKLLGPNVRMLAKCDVKFKDRADNKMFYTDFRRVLERKDIDVVAIATHPGWHALISIAAMEAGKDVICEKPMTRFISEGRAVANAEKRYGRIFQLESKGCPQTKIRQMFEFGLVKKCDTVLVKSDWWKVSEWSGSVRLDTHKVPKNLDWDMYCGPAPLRPYHHHRTGVSHRGYWDYEGGGLGDMGTHSLFPMACIYGRDLTHPVEVTPYAPPAHPEACGLWGWCELKYADGFTWVIENIEPLGKKPDQKRWGKPYPFKSRNEKTEDFLKLLSEEDRKKLDELPKPKEQPYFPEAIRTRQQTGSHAERSHHVATVIHLCNVAFRCGRPLKFDPDTEQIIGDEEANRLVNQPMRSPWRLA